MSDNSQFIVHYTKLNVAIESILPNNQIRFVNVGGVNDPKEYQYTLRQEIEFEFDKNSHSESLKHEFIEENIKTFQHSVKICCFSKGGECSVPDNNLSECLPNMWAHYGQNHRGVCLVFDKKKLKNCLEKNEDCELLEAKNISYEKYDLQKDGRDDHCLSNFQENKANYMKAYVKEKLIPLFYTKHHNWQTENEYRMLLWDNSPTQSKFRDINFKDSLVKVVLGLEVPSEYLPSIKAVLNDKPNYREVTVSKVCLYGSGVYQVLSVEE